MLSNLKNLLSHHLARGLDIDSPEAIRVQRRIIDEKPFLKALYNEWYTDIMDSLPKDVDGPVVEIGSGGGFLKDVIPDVITSDILPSIDGDIVLDAHYFPFKENSLKGIVMVNVFHHLHTVGLFLKNAAHCVKPGGAIIMLEPWNTWWSRFVYTYLHHEPFDPDAREWDFPEGGPLSQSNQALPWIVFDRDRDTFEREFKEWRISMVKVLMPFCYMLSGGVSYRSLLPGSLFNVCRKIEGIFDPWINFWGMFAFILLVREDKE